MEPYRSLYIIEQRDQRARLERLVIDPDVVDRGIEERMVGVAGALCEAFELDGMEIAAAPQNWKER